MLRAFNKIFYHILVRFFWKKLNGLLKFQATEAESAWQLQRIIPRLDSLEMKRDVFEHYMEEMYHAELFADQAKKQAMAEGLMHLPRLPIAERQPIIEESEDLWRFFAFLSVGEASAVKQFSSITHAIKPSSLKKTLKSILRDESKHVVDAKHHASALASAEELRLHSRNLKFARFRGEWMRQGLIVTDALSSALLWAVYWLVAPLGWRAAKQKIYGPIDLVENSPLRLNIQELKV